LKRWAFASVPSAKASVRPLPVSPLRSRGLRCSRVLRPPNPREAMASSLPFRPWSSPGPRAFRLEAVWRLESSTPNSLSCTSTPPQRLLPLRPASLPTSHADHGPPSRGTRSHSLALQHFRIGWPLFARSLLRARPVGFAFPTGGPVPRVWLPSRRRFSFPILGSLFQPPTLLGFALQSFFPVPWSNRGLPRVFPLLRFSTKPFSLVPALQRLDPTRRAVPLLRPDGLGQVGAPCSPGLLWPLRLSLR
jgi:hypothetical protein